MTKIIWFRLQFIYTIYNKFFVSLRFVNQVHLNETSKINSSWKSIHTDLKGEREYTLSCMIHLENLIHDTTICGQIYLSNK